MAEPTGIMPDGVRHDQAEKLIVNQRRTIAARMRRSGATYQQIADTARYPSGEPCYPPGTHRSTVFVDVQRGLKEALTELHLESEELREQTSQRLDDWLLRLTPGIAAGDVKAINTAVRIEEFRSRLYGYQEPERHEVITVDALDAAARELAEEINRRAAIDARQGQSAS
jgi:hypothetical protein